ncbi:hypothetical protein [Devosia submarina]|uniref:hypothetical protein n=1 Tax=Devosia submarina TaxID=1173082 RepID=UPI000D333323|nr:hypothetical protein [Devosia submarina]
MNDAMVLEVFEAVQTGRHWQVVDKRNGRHVQCGPLDEFAAAELAALLSSMALDMAPDKPTIH